MRKYLFLLAAIAMLCSCSGEKTEMPENSGDQFPIMAWIGVPESETTVERFKELKESGININFSVYSSLEAVEKALEVARQTGVKLMPACPELSMDTENAVKRLMNHPALAGYHLRDEPGADDFSMLGEWVRKIQAIDSRHPCYINLFPNYAGQEVLIGKEGVLAPGEDPYAKHVEMFLAEVPVQFISFDHYPVVEENGMRSLRPGWYKNLEIIAEASRTSSKPFWAFALAIAHKPYPIPTVAELRLQMFSNLAYGAQALQYFTYWHPGDDTPWDFHDSPINLDGSRTVVYDRIQEVNREIHSLSHLFLGAELLSVWHTGSQIPEGTRPIDQLPAEIRRLDTGDGGAVVSLLKNGERHYLVVVNRDFQSPMSLSAVTEKKVKRVLKDGTMASAREFPAVEMVGPGDMVIFTWGK
ncbi:MAG: hypothetical protein PHN65_05810 [Petrimonas mucosa]|jgi:hypothetical protein|uniref:hypothetical protein n=2 Tax=Petrimonas mucosa TaxID=1642646 RepID=UPI0008E181B9|nr:hypothetical protein [Petrimonas mucosa]MDD3560986.1 hypothetical protein [Petrimonas mucosa]SFU55031.1 hypothetical protein SAMN05216364_102323 [Porphyromonadaceae bacterium KHP3R9]